MFTSIVRSSTTTSLLHTLLSSCSLEQIWPLCEMRYASSSNSFFVSFTCFLVKTVPAPIAILSPKCSTNILMLSAICVSGVLPDASKVHSITLMPPLYSASPRGISFERSTPRTITIIFSFSIISTVFFIKNHRKAEKDMKTARKSSCILLTKVAPCAIIRLLNSWYILIIVSLTYMDIISVDDDIAERIDLKIKVCYNRKWLVDFIHRNKNSRRKPL